jgi:class 3 adenylate cyclase
MLPAGHAPYGGGVDHDELRAAGLYDPDAANAGDRLALLEHLVARGASLDEMVDAHERGYLAAFAGELVGRDEPRLSVRELAARADLDMGLIERVRRAAGLAAVDPDDRIYREADVETFRLFAVAGALFGEGPTLEFTRTVGASVAAITDSAATIFGVNVAAHFDEQGMTELEQAQASEAGRLMLLTQVPAAIETLFVQHVHSTVRRALASRTGAHTARLAVGFLDLVRSTALVQGLAPEEVAGVIGTFEQLATEFVGAAGGRVVKTIGDEVMYVVPDAADAARVALGIREAVIAESRLPTVRGGVAYGDLIRGYGDYYGTDVNLAARIVQLADPGQILVTAALADAAGESVGLRFEAIPDAALRGFEDPVPLRRLERA